MTIRQDCYEIHLTKGYVALVDWEDAHGLIGKKWCVTINRSANGERPYAVRRKPGHPHQFLYLHREVCAALPGQDVDHINGDTLDNRRGNLRSVTRSRNNLNRRGVRGISYSKAAKLWHVYINVDGKRHSRGYAKTREAAITKRLAAEKEFGL